MKMIDSEVIRTYEEALRKIKSKAITKEETRNRWITIANACEDVLDERELKGYRKRQYEKLYEERRKNW